MSDQVTTLTADLLIHELKEITKWQSLGFFLGLSMADIKEIEENCSDMARRRMEMLDRWMRRELSPSWLMVIEALEKMSELRLAHQLREKYCTQQHKDEKPPTIMSEEQADSQALERVLKVDRKDRLVQEMEGFEDRYLVIVTDMEAAIKSRNPSVRNIEWFSNYYMSKEVTKVEEMFNQLKPLDYLNYAMLEKIIKYFLKQDQPVVAELNDYIQELEKFKCSTSVQEFMESIEAAQRPLSATESSATITVILRLVGGWLTKTMNDLDKLLKALFEDKSSVLSHIKIVRGSVIITYLAPQTEAKYLITIVAAKISIIDQVGVCEVQVGDTVVTSTQNETSKFSFESSLVRAVYNDDIDVLSFLLDINTSPDAADDDKQTALIWGSLLSNSKAVSVLLKANANPNIQSENGTTPLHAASCCGHCNIVGMLLNANANPNLQTASGSTPLHLASQEGYNDIVGLLLEARANPNIPRQAGATSLHAACHSGHCNIVSMLLNANANPNLQTADGSTPLYLASQEGYSDVVGLLLEAKANPYLCRWNVGSPLLAASYFGHSNIVGLLLNANANHSIEDNNIVTPLYAASQEGHIAVVSLLLKAKADPNHSNGGAGTPLHIASRQGHSDIVRLLLKANSDFNFQADNGATPLHIASYCGHSDIISILLTASANPNSQDKRGMTPLYVASEGGHCGAIKLLLEANSDPNLFTNNVETPLMSACFNCYPQVVRLLLTSGADPNLQTVDDCFTALMCACHVGCFESAELLLMYGADYSLQSHDGLTALDMAACKGHDDIVDLIQTIELSQSSSTSPVPTATEIATNVDNKALASLYQSMEKMLVEKTESLISTQYQNLEKVFSQKHEQELQQFPF